MLHYFSTWNTVKRQQRALFKALALWQSNADEELGEFGLSVTTDISVEAGSLTFQFNLHHQAGGQHDSGIVTLPCDAESQDWDWLSDVLSPFFSEFLLPNTVSDSNGPEIQSLTNLRIVEP